jgi:hypothetical protein
MDTKSTSKGDSFDVEVDNDPVSGGDSAVCEGEGDGVGDIEEEEEGGVVAVTDPRDGPKPTVEVFDKEVTDEVAIEGWKRDWSDEGRINPPPSTATKSLSRCSRIK